MSADDPIRQFKIWFEEAKQCDKIEHAEAMCLSTVDRAGRPSGRMVLLKGIDKRGFVFYTNTLSAKGDDLKGTMCT